MKTINMVFKKGTLNQQQNKKTLSIQHTAAGQKPIIWVFNVSGPRQFALSEGRMN